MLDQHSLVSIAASYRCLHHQQIMMDSYSTQWKEFVDHYHVLLMIGIRNCLVQCALGRLLVYGYYMYLDFCRLVYNYWIIFCTRLVHIYLLYSDILFNSSLLFLLKKNSCWQYACVNKLQFVLILNGSCFS